MVKNRIISAILTGALLVTMTPRVALNAKAEGSGRQEWTGYDMSSVNFSTWDGTTYDTSWFTGDGGRTVHAGTEDDPYLIEDADDLAGLYLLTDGATNVSSAYVEALPGIDQDKVNLFNCSSLSETSQTLNSGYSRYANIVTQHIKFPGGTSSQAAEAAPRFLWVDTQNPSLLGIYCSDFDPGGARMQIDFYIGSTTSVRYKTKVDSSYINSTYISKDVVYEQDFLPKKVKNVLTDINWDYTNEEIFIQFNGVKLEDGTEIACLTPFTLQYKTGSYINEYGYRTQSYAPGFKDFSSMHRLDPSQPGLKSAWTEDFSNCPERLRLISTNCTLKNYINWYFAGNNSNGTTWKTATDPTFEGKHFKLMCDIEDVNAISPVKYTDGYGFAGDFNLNGHVLKGSSFGNLLEPAKIYNGTIVVKNNGVFTNSLLGTIENVEFLPETLFDRSIIETKVSLTTLVNSNLGEIHNIDTKLTTSSRVQITAGGTGSVEGVDIQLVHPTNDLNTQGQTYPLLFTLYGGTVRNVTIDADRDLVGTETQTYSLTSRNIVCTDAYNIEVKDFIVYTELSECTPFPITGNIYNSSSHIGAKLTPISCQSSGGSTNTLSGSGNLINCTIDYTLDIEGEITGCGYKYSASNNIIDNCDINIEYRARNVGDNALIKTQNITNSTLNFKCLDSPIGYISPVIVFDSNGTLQNTSIKAIGASADIPSGVYSTYYGSVVRGAQKIDNCDLYVRNYAGTGPIINSDNNSNESIVSNCVIDTELVYKNYQPIINANKIESTKISGKYSNVINTSTNDTHYLTNCNNQYTNSEVHILFDQSCNNKDNNVLGDGYQFAGGLHISSLKDCIVSINSKSENVVLRTPFRGGASYYSDPFFENSIILMNNIIIDGSDDDYRPSVIFLNKDLIRDISNLYIYGENIGVSSRMKPFSVIDYGYRDTKLLSNCYSNIQFRESSKDTPIAFANCYTSGSFMGLVDIAFESNTENGESCLVRFGQTILNNVKNGNSSVLTKNIYLNLENAQSSLIPSATADGTIPGLFAKKFWSNTYDIDSCYLNDLSYSMYLNDMIGMSNIIVPTGHSTVLQYYNPDETTVDSWNSNKEYVVSWANNQILPESEQGDVLNLVDDPAVSYINNPSEAALTGELAYRLDNGSSQYRRSRSWTVLEEDVDIINSLTNEVVGTIPAGLFLTGLEIKPSVMKDPEELNLSPIYKLKINQVENGTVEAKGLAGKSTSAGDVFIKSNTNLETVERTANNSYAFAFATQSFYGSTPSKIPSTANQSLIHTFGFRDNYTINGYKINAADTEITPVFKVARSITVEIENNEKGTIVPSALVSTSGETITIEQVCEDGYIISDLKLNGEALTKSKFIMPDENVVITGKAVPFEGGITKYSVFGFDGVIDQIEHTINVKVPRMGNIANALADIEYIGEFVTPSADARVDLTNPVVYTVTYGDGRTIDYTVTVEQTDYAMRITDFSINGRHAEINQATRTIKLEMPYGTDLSSLVADVAYSAETINPADGAIIDFRVPQLYTLYTSGMDNVTYTVTVVNNGDDIAEINKYVYSGYNGVIDNTKNTITLNVPKALDTSTITPSVLNFSGKSITPSKKSAVTQNDNQAEYMVLSQSGIMRAYNLVINRIEDNEAEITDFKLGGYSGLIDNDERTITITVPKTLNLVNVVPDILTYTGKSIYPRVDTAKDFTQRQTYTVVAPDNTEYEYEVKVKYLNDKALITYFELYGFEGDINQEDKTINVRVPYGFNLTDTAPTSIEYSEGATLTPDQTVRRDFTVPQDYTVVSQDGTVTNTYTVTCTNEEAYDNRITKFVLGGVEGEITDIGNDKGTIVVNIRETIPNTDYSNVIPDIIRISTGATIAPAADTPRNFENTLPVYRVTGNHSGTREYIVTLNIIPLDRTAKITHYEVEGYPGVIDDARGKITVTIPSDATVDLTNTIPDVTWQGKEITPTDGNPVDLTTPVDYTVKAEHPDVTKTYTVEVIEDDSISANCLITKYVLNGIMGEIDQRAGTITINITKAQEQEFRNVLVPDEIVWRGDTLTPDESTAVNGFDNIVYTVATANKTKEYTLIISVKQDNIPPSIPNRPIDRDDTVEDPPENPPENPPEDIPDEPYEPDEELDTSCIITEYIVGGYKADINQDKLTISLKLPLEKKDAFKNIVPEHIEWQGASLTPSETEVIDLTERLVYTVTAEDTSVKRVYSIKVEWAGKDDNPYTGFTFEDIIRAVILLLAMGSVLVVNRRKDREQY